MSSVRSFSHNSSLDQTLNASTVLEQKRILNRKRYKDSLFWFAVNLILLAIIVYDLSQTCPMYMSYYHYVEYSLIIILTINVLSYFVRFLKHYCSMPTTDQIAVALEQKMGNQNPDMKFGGSKTPTRLSSYLQNSPNLNMTWNQTPGQITPLNMSAVSWRSDVTPNDSMAVNYSTQSSPWGYRATPNRSLNNVPTSSFQNLPELDEIDDDEYDPIDENEEATEEANETPANPVESSNNILSSFWTHPMTKNPKDYSMYVNKIQYQLSTQSPTGSPSKSDDKSASQALEVWTRINVDTVALTHWNENLRMWISQTILQRLVKEFDVINDELAKHNMMDVKIGTVGLDRLRKTASTTQIVQFIPSLLTVIPFLELHANQEYLVQRIRDLAVGGCMSDFRWNRGGNFNGKPWDDTLPADCNIVMHILAAYLDTQLLPSPNMPDKKAFSGRYYVRTTDKIPTLSPSTIFIQEVIEKPPHYRVIVAEKIYEMVKGYNNLFHSILFFIYHVNKMEQGMLGRVNLGKAGINMLWIIGLDE